MTQNNKHTFWNEMKKYKVAYVFIAPAIIGMILMHFSPLVQGVYMSFLDLNIDTLSMYLKAPFVLFKNYHYVLTDPNSPMRTGIFQAVRNTFFYALIVTYGTIIFGMLVALMLNRQFKGRGFVRTTFIFPWIVPSYVTGILWGFMWQQDKGIINHILYDAPIIGFLLFRILHVHWICELATMIVRVICMFAVIPFKLVLAIFGVSFQTNQLIADVIPSFPNISSKMYPSLFVVLNNKVGMIIGKIFSWMPQFLQSIATSMPEGITNAFLSLFPLLPGTTNSPHPAWLTGQNTFWAIIIPTIWRGWPLAMLMLLAGLQSISQEFYEAAEIDGANGWQKFWHITWPLLKPVWSILILFGMIFNVYSFNIVYMMFGFGAGFPGEWGDL
ncbi:carbohydrate ABC transporter permease, partial [Candidatus Margulisiibacteriota bacterium]